MIYRVRRHEVTQPSDQSYRFIPLTRKLNAIVDTKDFKFLSKWNWCVYTTGQHSDKLYAGRKCGSGFLPMHRAIMGRGVDHCNGNGLDNRRKNLRKCTRFQNAHNRGKNKNNKSGYKGVYWSTRDRKWKVKIMKNRKEYQVGLFTDKEKAARAYDERAKELHGRFARLNFC